MMRIACAVLVWASAVWCGTASAGSGDLDGDGYTVAGGDCCDTTADGCSLPAAVNPSALEFVGNGIDDNCDDTIDEAQPACTGDFDLDDTDPLHAASAIELCRVAGGPMDFGVVDGAITRSNGDPVVPGPHMGLHATFGSVITPVVGARMLGLSSGYSRAQSDPGFCNGSSGCSFLGAGTAPPGFPQAVPGCPTPQATVRDDPALSITLRAPSNAVGFRLRYRYFTYEWPEWVCNSYNDQMLVLMDPPPPGSIGGNIAFDSANTPVGPNADSMTMCDPDDLPLYASECSGTCPDPPDPYCPDGDGDLADTGFIDDGGTTWQVASAPVSPLQTFDLRLTVFDVGDVALDSTALFDGFEWILRPGGTVELFLDGFE